MDAFTSSGNSVRNACFVSSVTATGGSGFSVSFTCTGKEEDGGAHLRQYRQASQFLKRKLRL